MKINLENLNKKDQKKLAKEFVGEMDATKENLKAAGRMGVDALTFAQRFLSNEAWDRYVEKLSPYMGDSKKGYFPKGREAYDNAAIRLFIDIYTE